MTIEDDEEEEEDEQEEEEELEKGEIITEELGKGVVRERKNSISFCNLGHGNLFWNPIPRCCLVLAKIIEK